MANEEPSGLMGKPEVIERFTEFEVQDIVLYVDNDVLDEYLGKNKLLINIEGYGLHEFEIME